MIEPSTTPIDAIHASGRIMSPPPSNDPAKMLDSFQDLSTDFIPDNQELYCKILLSNILAGSLIGKNGATISTIRQKSGASIRISNVVNIYSPERVALISGYKDALNLALTEVVELGSQPYGDSNISNIENGIMMKVIIPKSSVSLLIGKGGQRINGMRQLTGSKIHVSTREEALMPLNERVVKIFGSDVAGVSSALMQVVTAIQSDPLVKEMNVFEPLPTKAGSMIASPINHYSNLPQISPYPNSTGPGSMMHHPTFPVGPSTLDYNRLYGMEPWMSERTCEIFMQVPDAYVGMLVGKNGQHITDIKNASSAKVEISKKGDFVEGTTDRLVTISGSLISTHSAHARLMKRIMELQQLQDTRKVHHDF